MRNRGGTPAIDAELGADMLPFLLPVIPAARINNGIPQGAPDSGTDVDAQLKKLCANKLDTREHLPPLLAVSLYPDSPPTRWES